jgi:rhodanese-related sulfurtransferase
VPQRPDKLRAHFHKGIIMQDFVVFFSHHTNLLLAAGLLIAALLVVEFLRAQRGSNRLDVPSAIQLINRAHAVVIDIRPTDIYRQGHITDAKSMTSQDMLQHPLKLEKFKNKPLIVVCSAGIESQKIATALKKRGLNAHSLTGGMHAWQQADIPTVKE